MADNTRPKEDILADLFSFQRIAAENGWSMAALGILIDMTCLALLALIISRVPKVVALLDRASTLFQIEKGPDDHKPETGEDAPAYDDFSREGLLKIGGIYKECATDIGETFPLSALYDVSQKKGLPHPHLTIKSMREAGLLLPEGDGKFTWNL